MTEKEFVKKIKIALAEAGLNQSELAKKMGIKKQAVSNWFAGYRKPKVETLQKIAEATGKPLNYFFENKGNIGNSGGNNTFNNNSFADLELIKKDIEILKLRVQILEGKKGKGKKPFNPNF
ncbi:MAG: helix-turn-helix domain-containing protein [Candidatus Avelusimicrobium sp.]|uniref:helix-turn-helix domain-containing protein n=1 Tax=Candidatus Avelusimicrobium sp. TaxID=3048833 RepID=UPI003F11BABA